MDNKYFCKCTVIHQPQRGILILLIGHLILCIKSLQNKSCCQKGDFLQFGVVICNRLDVIFLHHNLLKMEMDLNDDIH